jgi:transcriptional regulator with XRE-family HTH domain
MAKPSNVVDVYVGARLRMRRMILGMSQSKLGELVGVTFQQIQKYENGSNRISVHRLRLTARALEVSPSYFLDGIIAPLTPAAIPGAAGPSREVSDWGLSNGVPPGNQTLRFQ